MFSEQFSVANRPMNRPPTCRSSNERVVLGIYPLTATAYPLRVHRAIAICQNN